MNNNYLIALSLGAIRLMVENKMYDDAIEQLDSLSKLLKNQDTVNVNDCITDKVFKSYDDLCNQ
jgi:hypothetical protein